MTKQLYFFALLLAMGLVSCAPRGTVEQAQGTEKGDRPAYNPEARFLSQAQAPGAYFIAVPDDVDGYRALMQAYVEGDKGGLPLEAVTWVTVPLREEPNRAIARHAAQQAGEHVSPLGTVVDMEDKDGIFTVYLQAHKEGNSVEIAIAEPPVRETLLAFDFVERVVFKP